MPRISWIFFGMPRSFFAAVNLTLNRKRRNSCWLNSARQAINASISEIGAAPGERNLLVLTNAGYGAMEGQSTESFMDRAQQMTGCSSGGRSLLSLHTSLQEPLWRLLYRKDTGKLASALDAIRVILSTTLGNQGLHVMDHGKQTYTVLPHDGKGGFKLSFRHPDSGDEDECGALEIKIRKQQITLEEVVHFQGLLDARARCLRTLDYKELFGVDPTDAFPPPCATATRYVACCQCSQPTLNSRAVDFNRRFYCMPCFHRLHVSGNGFGLK